MNVTNIEDYINSMKVNLNIVSAYRRFTLDMILSKKMQGLHVDPQMYDVLLEADASIEAFNEAICLLYKEIPCDSVF